MKNFIREIFVGKDNKISGLIAFGILGLIVLGCNCNKEMFDSTNKSGNSSNSAPVSNTAPVSNSGNPFSTPRPPSKADGEIPSDAELQNLVQITLQDFTDAVEAGDFSDFRETGSKAFQQQFSTEKLNATFIQFVTLKMAIVPMIRSTAAMSPSYSPLPNISQERRNKTLNVKGVYNTSPNPMNFTLKYLIEDERWKLIGIEIRFQPK